MKTSFTVWRFIFLSILAIANLSPSRFTLWSFNGMEFRKEKFPVDQSFTASITQIQKASIGSQKYCIKLDQGHADIHFCDDSLNRIAWTSPANWLVKEAFFSDLNLDGNNEVALLVWRPFRPWPVDGFLSGEGRINAFHNKNGMSCHLILIGPVNGQFKELWAGSAMADPIRNLVAADFDKDGQQELAGIEYKYNASFRSGSMVLWEWNGFGFSLASRQTSRFSELLLLQTKSNMILVAH